MAEDKSWDETIKSFHHADDKEEEGEDANGVIDYLKGCDSSDGDDLSAASCDECVVVSALFNVSSILTKWSYFPLYQVVYSLRMSGIWDVAPKQK